MAEKKAKAKAEKKPPVTQARSQVWFEINMDRVSSVKSETKVEKAGPLHFLGLVGSGQVSISAYGDFGGQNFDLGYVNSIKVGFRPGNEDFIRKYLYMLQDCQSIAQQNLLFGVYQLRISGYQDMYNSNIKNLIGAKEKAIEISLNEKTKMECRILEG